MRYLIFVLCLIAIRAAGAATPYDAALSEMKNVGPADVKDLDALIARPPNPALLEDKRAAGFLEDNRAALEAFRRASEQTSDGYLFAPKAEKLDSTTPIPQYQAQLKLFKLIILEAEIAAARRQRGTVETDMLAAAGFLEQLSDQKSGVMVSALVGQLCLRLAYPMLTESIQSRSSSAAYLKELSARLTRVERNQDFMQAAVIDEAERHKGAMREGLTPEKLAAEQEKLPFWRRPVARRAEDPEIISIVVRLLERAEDDKTKMLIESFRANAPARIDAFLANRDQEILSRKKEVENRGELAKLEDGWKIGRGDKAIQQRVAQATVDVLLSIAAPRYQKLVPLYHVFLCELNVLRAGLAVEMYRREKRRLPDDLEQLVPSFLSEVPRDSFNGFQSMRYGRTKNRFSVYSFGPDGKDDGGLVVMDWDVFYSSASASTPGDIVFAD